MDRETARIHLEQEEGAKTAGEDKRGGIVRGKEKERKSREETEQAMGKTAKGKVKEKNS